MIDKLTKLCIEGCVPYIIPLVYDETLSYIEVLYAVSEKINLLIDNNNKINDTIINVVNETIQNKIDDGSFADIIGEQILNDIKAQLINLQKSVADNGERITANTNELNNKQNRLYDGINNVDLNNVSKSKSGFVYTGGETLNKPVAANGFAYQIVADTGAPLIAQLYFPYNAKGLYIRWWFGDTWYDWKTLVPA